MHPYPTPRPKVVYCVELCCIVSYLMSRVLGKHSKMYVWLIGCHRILSAIFSKMPMAFSTQRRYKISIWFFFFFSGINWIHVVTVWAWWYGLENKVDQRLYLGTLISLRNGLSKAGLGDRLEKYFVIGSVRFRQTNCPCLLSNLSEKYTVHI